MSSFKFLKDMLSPEKAEAPDAASVAAIPGYIPSSDPEKEAQDTLRAVKQKQRSGMYPMGSTSDDKLEDTDAPYEYLGPGEIKAAGNLALKSLVGKGGMGAAVAGILGPKGARSRVAHYLESKEGEDLGHTLRKVLYNDPVGLHVSGAGVIDSSGKNAADALKDLRNVANEMGVDVVDYNSPLAKGLSADTLKRAGGVYVPGKKMIALNPDFINENVYGHAGVLRHEIEHAIDDIVRKKNLNQYLNYNDYDAEKLNKIKKLFNEAGLEAPKSITDAYKNDAFSKGMSAVSDLSADNKVEQARQLSDAFKGKHFNAFKNFELEQSLMPIVKGSSSFNMSILYD
jgi:hypothetical protein